jgi:hypothetical protein
MPPFKNATALDNTIYILADNKVNYPSHVLQGGGLEPLGIAWLRLPKALISFCTRLDSVPYLKQVSSVNFYLHVSLTTTPRPPNQCICLCKGQPCRKYTVILTVPYISVKKRNHRHSPVTRQNSNSVHVIYLYITCSEASYRSFDAAKSQSMLGSCRMHALVRQKLVYTKTRVKEASGRLQACAFRRRHLTSSCCATAQVSKREGGTVGGQEWEWATSRSAGETERREADTYQKWQGGK